MVDPSILNPDFLARPRGYSHGVLYPAGARLLFIAGQIAWDGAGQLVGPGDLTAQFRRSLENVLAVVRAAGGAPRSLGRLTIYVTDKRLYQSCTREIGAAYRELMGTHFPAMALVQVADLLEPGALVEIEGTAVI